MQLRHNILLPTSCLHLNIADVPANGPALRYASGNGLWKAATPSCWPFRLLLHKKAQLSHWLNVLNFLNFLNLTCLVRERSLKVCNLFSLALATLQDFDPYKSTALTSVFYLALTRRFLNTFILFNLHNVFIPWNWRRMWYHPKNVFKNKNANINSPHWSCCWLDLLNFACLRQLSSVYTGLESIIDTAYY